MHADGTNVRQLSANVEQDNTPWMLPDGRVLYMRWEYVDRSRVQFHHLWAMNPDGTSQMIYFGNMHPGTVMLDAKPVPGSTKVVASFSPGHGQKEHAGHVTLVSPDAGPDEQRWARRITRESVWRDPWAFSEDCFIAARERSIYIIDGGGRAEPVYTLPAEWDRMELHEPRPLAPRPRETVIPPRTDPDQPTGRLVVADILHGRRIEGVSRGEIKQLLVLETLPKPVNFSGTMEPISLDGTFTLPRILGTVPVEADGSAYFEAPALRPLFFVALDAGGVAVKRMQSFTSVMPGETTGCVGCHENRNETSPPRPNLAALGRPPSRIAPIEGAPQVFDFPRDVQPILDKHCVRCHNDRDYAGRALLTGDRGPWYSHAYVTLMTRPGMVSHGRDAQGNLPPRGIGSGKSRLMTRIDGGHKDVRLSSHEQMMIRLWIDSGAPYPGTYAALGTGMEHVPLNADILAKRCSSCHTPMDPKKPIEGFRMHSDLLANLSRPQRSLALIAPLARDAGGLGLCGKKGPDGKPEAGTSPFASTDDPDYARLLAEVGRGKGRLEEKKRFDMAGFVPNRHYLREMRRYGVLPADLDPASPGRPIDPYEVDEAYWRSFWYAPASR
jgi:cytochrome c553